MPLYARAELQQFLETTFRQRTAVSLKIISVTPEASIIVNTYNSVLACAIYISPQLANLQNEIHSINTIVNTIKAFNTDHVFIGGDFNKENTAIHFKQICTDNDLQIHLSPTMRTHDKLHHLDFILSKNSYTLQRTKVTQTLTSDHDLLSCTYSPAT